MRKRRGLIRIERGRTTRCLQKEKIYFRKNEVYVNWGSRTQRLLDQLSSRKEILQLAQDMENWRVMLADASLLDPDGKWLEPKKKEINTRKVSAE